MLSLPPDLAFLGNRAALKRIAAAAVTCAAIGAAYAFLATPWFESVLTVIPARPQKAGIAAMLGGDLSGIAGGVDGAMGGAGEAARIAAVLESVAVSDAVIQKFDLRTRYEQKYQETARKELWEHCAVSTLTKASLVQLTCEDTDPEFVRSMLAYFAEVGNDAFRRVNVSSASEEVRFLASRVTELRKQADDAAGRVREFQEKHKLVDLESQAKAVVSSVAALNSQRISKQLELEYARTFSSNDEASLQQLQSQIAVVDDKLRQLEQPLEGQRQGVRSGGRGAASGMFPAAMAVPQLRAEYERLFRDRLVAESTLVFALGRLEAARANEARDVSTFQVLDPPALPTRKSRPKRAMIVALGLLAGLAAGLAMEWFRADGIGTLLAEREAASGRDRAA